VSSTPDHSSDHPGRAADPLVLFEPFRILRFDDADAVRRHFIFVNSSRMIACVVNTSVAMASAARDVVSSGCVGSVTNYSSASSACPATISCARTRVRECEPHLATRRHVRAFNSTRSRRSASSSLTGAARVLYIAERRRTISTTSCQRHTSSWATTATTAATALPEVGFVPVETSSQACASG